MHLARWVAVLFLPGRVRGTEARVICIKMAFCLVAMMPCLEFVSLPQCTDFLLLQIAGVVALVPPSPRMTELCPCLGTIRPLVSPDEFSHQALFPSRFFSSLRCCVLFLFLAPINYEQGALVLAFRNAGSFAPDTACGSPALAARSRTDLFFMGVFLIELVEALSSYRRCSMS